LHCLCRVADHRSDEWLLMGSPWPVICIAIFYVYFVRSLGPRLMKDRLAFNLDPVVRVYDLVQILCCLWLIRRVSDKSTKQNYMLFRKCNLKIGDLNNYLFGWLIVGICK
jgi:hypothetical protein